MTNNIKIVANRNEPHYVIAVLPANRFVGKQVINNNKFTFVFCTIESIDELYNKDVININKLSDDKLNQYKQGSVELTQQELIACLE